jgi:2-keto-3-deoxy-L-rhamnonate aldolase RhmA
MRNNLEKFIEKIEKGPAIGTYVSLADSAVTSILGYAGSDFLFIDMEHTALGKKEILEHIVAASESGTASFVRVPWNDPVLVKPIIDMGPDAIIFPWIRNAEDAKRAIAACEYPLSGIRGYGPKRANLYGAIDTPTYLEEASKQTWRILQIELADAVENIDEILSVEGVDSIMVGPSDLSGSMGVLQQTAHPEVKAAFDRIAKSAKEHNIPFGVATGYAPETVKDWLKRGISWMCFEGDTGFLMSGITTMIASIKEIASETKK